ncbi:Pyrimidine 5'-nucleotidase YjjG [Vibrio aerogenes CECT 7868]|uniref:Pyrimidine 5'-nucleotidase YjjG n=1 Tax=Vibrio aerogenes CECT 7868 TaxID=1216006 RepID=A0A1M5YKK7_9VIBR|nr:HAD family hydrolase [Vibrio aerogenes]SHI12522.1 Pyrimidine 5'-nucleotidase YjjG [Vibrio aerogenes CECT 7868]
MIKAVYFDLDNTLVDRDASIDAFSRIFIEHYSHRLRNPSVKQISTIIKQTDNGGYLAEDSPYQKIWQAIGAELCRQADWIKPVLASEVSTFWRTEFPGNTVEMPGVEQLVRQLVQSGYHVGIISNGAESSRRATLAATSLNTLILQMVSSGQFGVSKPDPSIFTDTVQDAGFLCGECVYIGDHPEKDICGAMNAGMHAIYFSGFHPDISVPEGAPVIHHLSDVIPALNRIQTNKEENDAGQHENLFLKPERRNTKSR